MSDDNIINFPLPKKIDPELLSDSIILEYKERMKLFFNCWEQSSDKDKQLMCRSLYDASLIYIAAIKNLKKLTEQMGGK